MTQNQQPYIIAGPCSVESREQLQEVTAALCRNPRVCMIRGGVWKPRTRPGGFEGLGEPALRWMKEIHNSDLRMADGARVRFCCEVARPEHVELCQQYGITTVWFGARTTTNPFMVEELCAALQGSGMNVMVKNPVCPDLRLWLGAIERLRQAGLGHVAAVHRGFSLYHNNGYRNAPVWQVPMKLRREMPDLPILCDPSHIGGRRDLIQTISAVAMQLAYNGLIVEVHPHPDEAWSDAGQQITPAEFDDIIASLPKPNAGGPLTAEAELQPLRNEIDGIDHGLLRMLSRRMELSRQIADIKHRSQMTVYQSARWADVMEDRLKLSDSLGLDATFTKDILERIHAESIRVQMKQ